MVHGFNFGKIMKAHLLFGIISLSFACLATGAEADPYLDFSPATGVFFSSADGIEDVGLEYQELYFSGSSNYNSTGDGDAYAGDGFGGPFKGKGFLNVQAGGFVNTNVGVSGTASASTFVELIFTIENVSGISRSYEVDYGYGINGSVSTARGTTHEDWSVGIESSDLPLSYLDDSFESQNHDCASPKDDVYSCFNFYDSNDWYDYVTLDPGVIYTTHLIVSVNLAATAAPESPSWLLLIAGLAGCVFLNRPSKRGVSRSLSTT